MSVFALLLVVVAAFTHATWNLLAKKAASVGAPFVAAYTGFATLIYAPAAAWAIARFGFPMTRQVVICIVASGILHLAYSLVLQRGYQVADLSVVYPVARGTGPMLSALGAFTLLGEHITVGAVTGLFAVVGGIVMLATGGRITRLADPAARTGVAWGGATGTMIAGYTVVDGWGTKVLGINPILLDWCANTVRLLFLLPTVLRDWPGFRKRLTGYWMLAAAVGFLAPLGYILVLTALQMGAPLHAVAPAREMSMMVGALLGVIMLGEKMTLARLGGCALIIAGVVLLAI
ncbi:DMT family transporter [Parerythrobacter aurantius]|uniref:EamA family transporter n=1 Tax=Parerythrobacter aurantius TaxID=3127706 RepID=UPI00324C992D